MSANDEAAASPAETREGRAALVARIRQIVGYVPVGTLDLLAVLTHPDVITLTHAWLAASPAVSLPGEERLDALADAVVEHLESQAEPWSYADGVVRDAKIRAALRAGEFIREWKSPPIPGEQPGGQERDVDPAAEWSAASRRLWADDELPVESE